MNTNALFNIGYGLYVITSNDGVRDNGMICNTVCQLTSNPIQLSVTLNKGSYTHDTVKNTGKMNVCCLSTEAPFKVFEAFGFKSGRDTDKFADCTPPRSENGLVFLPKYINAYLSLKVENYIDLGSHGMFICTLSDAEVLNNNESMSYSYYQGNVKPKKDSKKEKRGYVCTLCGYVHEEETMPDDFVCPWCNHGKEFFEKL
ncbi:MAG: flavin reductase [Clostridia bacterium]|nr:flavin reductase [Clostridia bacterium]